MSHSNTPARPGAVLKSIRQAKGWTLAEVGRRTGFPISTLSKIENDRVSLTYDKLVRLSSGLGIDISLLFGDVASDGSAEPSQGRRSITRTGDGRRIDSPNYHHLYAAADLLNKRLIPIVVEHRARSLEEFGELVRHAGEEFIYVLEGEIEVHTSLYAPVRLKAGDSIYLDSTMGHAYLAAAPGVCRVLAVCSAHESQTIAAVRGVPNDETPDTGKSRRKMRPRPAAAAGKPGNKRAGQAGK